MVYRFTSRRYRPGDELVINQLYQDVTGRERSIAQHKWQWLSAPAGPGDIWLIHAIDEEGEKLIGHHGIMPLRFTRQDGDLLFGKVENTMVLPEYRQRILYPRYEVCFKEQYQGRYHALFATMGPDAAIRTRKASGYRFPVEWSSYLLATSLTGQVRRCSHLAHKAVRTLSVRTDRSLPDRISSALRVKEDRLYDAGFLSSTEATGAPFFQNFWERARHHHGVAPRRDIPDLKWRFWANPYKQHFTLVVDDQNSAQGYVIISVSDDHQQTACLEDYAVAAPSDQSYRILFSRLLTALRQSGVSFLSVISTTDPSLARPNRVFAARRCWCDAIAHRLRKPPVAMMPRFITATGNTVGIGLTDWTVTGVVFEGRA